MKAFKLSFTAGLAMFAMFFGSGNLIFPLKIGAYSGENYLIAGLGFFFTAVIVPFTGLFSMIIFSGDKDKYFSQISKHAPLAICGLIIFLVGPFGVIPRCILVSFGGFNLLYPQISLFYFAIFYLMLIYLIIFKQNLLVPLIGKYLGPVKILSIILIILFAIYTKPSVIKNLENVNPLILGITQGYQTMDLLAAFFFSITIIDYLKTVTVDRAETLRIGIYSSLIGAGLMSIIYFGFIYLGAYYAEFLIPSSPEKYLAVISSQSMGKYATLIVSCIIFISCIVTAASLTKNFAEFVQQDIFKNKINWFWAIMIGFLISLILALTGFNQIAAILGWVLNILYPALITLTIASILNYFYQFQYVKISFWLVLAVTIILEILV